MQSIDFIRKLVNICDDSVAIISTCGLTSRELHYVKDRPGNFYMVGAMGGASSFGLGVALGCPSRGVVVLDGDGAALMNLGSMATIGNLAPKNLIHIVLKNGCYASTGGQRCQVVDFSTIAVACGYKKSIGTMKFYEKQLNRWLLQKDGPYFVSMMVEVSKDKPPRPSISFADNYNRFVEFLKGGEE